MSAQTKPKTWVLTVNLADEARIQAMRTVLGYESGMRGLSMSQTVIDMVMEAIDLESYPKEVREELRELEANRAKRAVSKCLDVSGFARSA